MDENITIFGNTHTHNNSQTIVQLNGDLIERHTKSILLKLSGKLLFHFYYMSLDLMGLTLETVLISAKVGVKWFKV